MVEAIFEIGINMVETLITIDFVTRYLGVKYHDKRGILGFIAAWLILFTELSIINRLFIHEGVASLIPVIMIFLYAHIFLKGSAALKLWISTLIEVILVIIADGTNLVVCRILDYDPNDMLTVFNATRVISVIITKVILFYVTRIILRHKHKNPLENRSWIMLILVPTVTVISLSALMMAAMKYNDIMGYIICGMSGILLANIITYYFFSTLNKEYESELKIKLLEQSNENAEKELESAGAFVRQMQSARHDMQNQLTIISNYIEMGKYGEARSYINSLSDTYLPAVKNFINTDNEAFNAIVNSKIAVCNRKNIYIEIKEMRNALNDFDPIDTGILFGNLLDNAIEAAQDTDGRRITVDIKQKGYYLSILVTNSIKTSVLKTNEDLQTSKVDKVLHGIGIKSVKALVEKYDGMIDFFENNGEFCCHVMLYTAKG